MPQKNQKHLQLTVKNNVNFKQKKIRADIATTQTQSCYLLVGLLFLGIATAV